MTNKNTIQELKALQELQDLTKKSKKMGEIFSSFGDFPLYFFLRLRVEGTFFEMLDKDFGRKIENDSIFEIFGLVFKQLKEEQLINILHEMDPKGISNLLKDIKKANK